jgi:hypothetical protein
MINKIGYLRPSTLTDDENLKKESASSSVTAEKVKVPHTLQQTQLAESKSSDLALLGSIQQRIIGADLEKFVSPLQSPHKNTQIVQAEAQDAEARMRQQQVQTTGLSRELRGPGDKTGISVGEIPKDPVVQQLLQKLDDLNAKKQQIKEKLKDIETMLAALQSESPQPVGSSVLRFLLGSDNKESSIKELQLEMEALRAQLGMIDKEILQTMNAILELEKGSPTSNEPEDSVTSGQYRNDVQKTLLEFDESSAAVRRSNLLK